MNHELCPQTIARKQHQARIGVAFAAMLASACVLAMTVLMVTGPAGLV